MRGASSVRPPSAAPSDYTDISPRSCNLNGKAAVYIAPLHVCLPTAPPSHLKPCSSAVLRRADSRGRAGNGIATPCLGSKPRELSAVGQHTAMCLGSITWMLQSLNLHRLIVRRCLNLCRGERRKAMPSKHGVCVYKCDCVPACARKCACISMRGSVMT